MTISSNNRKAGPFIGNGSAATFPFTFKVFQASDLFVVRLTVSTGAQSTLVLGTDYTVTLNLEQDSNPGGSITLVAGALASGYNLIITSDIGNLQPTDLTNQGGFYPEVINDSLDRATIQIQQLQEQTDRTLKYPVTDPSTGTELPAVAQRAGKMLTFDELGAPIAGLSVDEVGTVLDNLANITTVANDLNGPDTIGTVATNIADVNTVASNMADVNTVADNIADVGTVATNIADVIIAADNVADINNFADVYQGAKASDPTLRNNGSPLQPGDMYFNTSVNELRLYSGSVWAAGTAGTVAVQRFSGTGSQTAFTLATAPSGENNTQVYINGVYQQKDTYGVTGTTLTFSTAPPAGTDNIEVVTISTLALGETDASLVTFLPAGDGAVERTVQAKLRETVSVKDFGAVGDGVTDDTTAINNWLDKAAEGVAITAPAGTYKFTSALTLAAVDNMSITGAGRQKTTFLYAGASTTNDIFTIGDGTTSFTGLHLEGFNIDSSTTMTAGTGLRIRKQQNGGTNIKDVSFSQLNAPKKLWDGIWFDNTNVTTYKGFEINVQNEALIVNGAVGVDTGSDLYLDDGSITFASVGVHCAGGFGGLYLGQVLFFGNTTHFKLDNGRVARFNREIILSDLAVFDGCKDYGIYVNDPLASGCNLTINAFIGSAGRIGTGGVGNNIHIVAYPNSRVTIGSGQIFNATGNGLWIGDASTLISISADTQITNNGAFGIWGNVPTNFVNYACTFQANTLGDVSPNIRPVFTYTPTVLASSGTLTTASGAVDYHRVGNRVWFDVYINITTNGTGASTITCSLPFQIRQHACAVGNTSGATYQALFAQLFAGNNYMQITYSNGTYPGADGQTLVVSGSCEVY